MAFQAREFATVELSVTYYRVPDARTVAGWVRKTPDEFVFSVKAWAVVELRNVGWVTPPTFELLRSLGLGFCSVDEPRPKGLMPPVAAATGPAAWVRPHGRTAAKWCAHEEAWERYDYTYSAEEPREWAPKWCSSMPRRR